MKTHLFLLAALLLGNQTLRSAPDDDDDGPGKRKGKGKAAPGVTNPPGPAGGPGTGRANPPGPAGGPGTGRVNPPGPAGGPGTGRANPPGPAGGPDTSRVNPPGPAGGPGTGRVNPPGPAGGPGTGRANPPGPAGGPGTSRANPPGPAGGPGTGRVNPPGPAGGPGAVRVNPPGPAGGPGSGVRFDSRVAVRSLVAPRRIARPAAPPVLALRRGAIQRTYDRTRNVVIVPADDGQSTELPYVAAPVLFVQGTAELLDQTADEDLRALAQSILEVHSQDPNARFVIEGHTSTDGSAEDNQLLSTQRASRTHSLLVGSLGVPAGILSMIGYGEDYAQYPEASEAQLQLDRRVLVVRTQ